MIQKLRIASLFGIHVLIFFHIYIYGDEVIGSIDFQEFFHSFIKFGVINAGVILVILAFIITLFFGRFFCGWACHFGAVQELAWWLLKKLGITPKTINSSLVTILPIFILINFYLAPNLLYALRDPWSGISVNLGMPEIWAFLPGFVIGTLTFLIDGFLIVYFLGRKGFCRFLCPWGAFLKVPNSLAMFKVRNVGGCSNCGDCTTNCPIGIDVNYEINNYGKVTNTNCTSCLICTEGCPTSAITYKWENPFNEDFQIRHYKVNHNMFNLKSITSLFHSVHKKDLILFPIVLLFGFSIDGLYGMGHFLSFGIALIAASQLIFIKKYVSNFKANFICSLIIVSVFTWHGSIKFSIWKGMESYKNNDYQKSISHLERAVKLYPKSIGKFHFLLAEMYMRDNQIIKAKNHALKALEINPDYEGPKNLLNLLN
jgi:polyferredoxin